MTPSPESPSSTNIAVLSTGTWGITLAGVLAENGHRVWGWDIDGELIETLETQRRHPKLEGYRVPTGCA